ncbi:MAG: hypothetical protein H0W83_11540 [Planctomycetes bacterium]|nr:hypothetical protein [Planctomycetota bacterium]
MISGSGQPSNLEMRTLQMVQIPLIYLLGGWFCTWYFPRRFTFDIDIARPFVMRFRYLPFLFVGIGSLGPAIASYGAVVSYHWDTDRAFALAGVRHMVLTGLMLILWDALWAIRWIPAWYDRYAKRAAVAPVRDPPHSAPTAG